MNVWIVHGSYTGGHAAAARALQQALRADPDVQAEVINVAEASTSPLPMSTAAEKALHAGGMMNRLRGWWFRQNFAGNPVTYKLTNAAMRVEAMFEDGFVDRARRERPDVIISTMSATNALLAHWKADGKLDASVQSVVTDFSAHRVWAQDPIQRYYVAGDAARQDLERFGVDPSRIAITGIPISADFAAPPREPSAARSALGLDPTLPTLLLAGGSLGYASFASLLETLDRLPAAFQAVVVTGRNEAAKEDLLQRQFTHPVHVEGYVADMADWIDASDVVVSNPGGLTTSEVLARGRPMLIPDPQPGLQELMVGRITATGAAHAVYGSSALAGEVSRLLTDPAAREGMQAAARAAGHGDAAAVVAHRVVEGFRNSPGGAATIGATL